MDYKIYILTYDSDMLFLDDEECADFYIEHIDDGYFKVELPISSEAKITSHKIMNLHDFIKNIEEDFKEDLSPSYDLYYGQQMLIDFNKLRMKLRDQTINKILNI